MALSKFVYNDCFKKIPYTGNMYEIDCKGNLRDTFHKRNVDKVDDNGVVRVISNTGEWFDNFSLAVLLAIVHRNITLPLHLLRQLEVLYKDNDPGNYSLYNTVWKSPVGKLSHPLHPGFCYIPGYSRYLINEQGELLSPIKGELLSPYEDANGYMMYGVQPDVGKRTIAGMHRLLCLAWKDYPATVDRLDVNHLNGDKSDNDLGNFEWATRSRNNTHAYETGLKGSGFAILVRNVETGDVTTYYSVGDAARHMGIEKETLWYRVTNGTDGRVYEGHQYKRKDDDTPWVIHDSFEDYRHMTPSKPVKTTHIETGKEREFKSVSAAAKSMDVNPGTLVYRLSKSDNVVMNEYLVSVL